MVAESVDGFWRTYQDTLSSDHPHLRESLPAAWGFGDTPELADALGQLVLTGRKRATATMLEEFIATGEMLPAIGELNVILDGADQPMCLIETTSVDVVPFNRVDEEFARLEGEGDGSLAYWQQAHESFFGRVAKRLGVALHPDTPVVCEQFQVLWPNSSK